MAKDSYYLNSMGIVLKRRDNAPIVKHIFGGAIKIIMVEKNIKKAYDFVMSECKKMLFGEFPIENFIISKTLKSYYKFPNRIAHNVLAKRQAQRDPGNKFSSNDRVPYCFIVNKKATLQGDMIETPEFIQSNNIQIDYDKYLTNQIQVPVSQIFELVDGYQNISNEFDKLIRYVHNVKLNINEFKFSSDFKETRIFRKIKTINSESDSESNSESNSDSDSESESNNCTDDIIAIESMINY